MFLTRLATLGLSRDFNPATPELNALERPMPSGPNSNNDSAHDPDGDMEIVPSARIPPRPLDWASVDTQWRQELSAMAPTSLRSLMTGDVIFLETETPGLLDSVQISLEGFTGKSWNWDPLPDPTYPLAQGLVRLKWACSCGRRIVQDVSPNLASNLARYLGQNNQSPNIVEIPVTTPSSAPTQNPFPGNHHPGQPSSTAPAATSRNWPTTLPVQRVPGSPPSNSNVETNNTLSQLPPIPASPRPTYILLCVDRLGKLKSAQTEVNDSMSDDTFFERIKYQYRELRGPWHYWLHPEQFDYCSFSKFERYYVDCISWKCNELPDHVDYHYLKHPPLKPYVAPIPPEEWRHRYQGLKWQRLEALPLIPQRVQRFQISTHTSREEFWGLNVEYRTNFKVVLVWHLIITAGGWAFFGWWLRGHPGDLQNAVEVVSLIFGALITFWSFLEKRVNHRRGKFKTE